ncbi:MAG: PLP-dependent aminotransferase family protein [Firmicutes bacterium]|nr:PLP-dependent aminotransferase family protein [Bacillota bacterium]
MDLSKHLKSIKLNHQSKAPLYLQIAEAVTAKIKDFSLPPGSKLPPERELAEIIGVSRTTAINAYRKLEQQGLIQSKIGSGTYVAESSDAADELSSAVPWSQLFKPYPQTPLSSIMKEMVSVLNFDEIISLGTGMPDPAYYPVEQFETLLHRHMGSFNKNAFAHISTEGFAPLKSSVAAHVRSKGINATAEETIILSGSQQGLYLLSNVLLEPGDYVVTESPTFIGAIQVFQAAGAKVLTLPTGEGFSLSILEDYLIRYRPKMLYVIPTFQNPTGSVLSESRRRELLSLASRHRLVVVEDDPYSELYFEDKPPLPLKAMDTYGGVVYLSTFSKILFPGLRTGFIVSDPALINRLAVEKQYVDLHSSNISQLMLHLYLEHGDLAGHLSGMRKIYKKRRDVLAKAIKRNFGDQIVFNLPGGGFYFWCKINSSVTTNKLLHETTKNGVTFIPGNAFYSDLSGDREFRLCYASIDESTISEGVKRMSKSFQQLSHTRRKKDAEQITMRPIV